MCGLVLVAACAAESSDATTIATAPVTTMEDTAVSFTLDVTGAYTTAGVLQPTHGTATVEGIVVTYTPNSNFFGADVLRAYVTTDGPLAETAFDITVLPVNDAPVGFEDELGECTVIATGGLAELIIPFSRTIQHHEPWLTLHGLRIVFERNRA